MRSMLEFLFSSEFIFPGSWTEEHHLGRNLEEITKLRNQVGELLEQEHHDLWEVYQKKIQALQNQDCQTEFERRFLIAAKLMLEVFRRMSEERN